MKWIFLLALLGLLSCQTSELELERKQLIASELNAKAEIFSDFDNNELRYLEIISDYIPERAVVTFMDKKGFVYFDLGNRTFSIKIIHAYHMDEYNVIIYPLSEKYKIKVDSK